MKKQGYSLIELVVSIAILSVVGVALIGLISYSLNVYNKTTDDANLQYEMQLAANRLEEQVFAADKGVSCGQKSINLYSAPDDATKKRIEIYFDEAHNQLLFQEYLYNGTSWSADGGSECFASYVKDFSVKVFDKDGNEISFPNVNERKPQKMVFTLEMELKKHTQNLDYTVAFRNDLLATDDVGELYE